MVPAGAGDLAAGQGLLGHGDKIDIRENLPGDLAQIERLYPDAFPDEDLLPVVRELLGDVRVLSLVAQVDGMLAGHVIFTTCGLAIGEAKIALLAPLGVVTARHKQGIGSALVREGLRRLAETETQQVCVLGDPHYYGRFGFTPEEGVLPPYPLPEEWRTAWQSLTLAKAPQPLKGKLAVPDPWLREALWSA